MADAFGALVRRLRVRAGLSQNELARRTRVDPSYINLLEKQRRGVPSRAVVLALAGALGAGQDDRERLLVAAGHCPESILRAGGWDEYRALLGRHALLAIEAASRGEPVDAPEQIRRAV
jgi:transcriptional regulator with XRE-family HTH domain